MRSFDDGRGLWAGSDSSVWVSAGDQVHHFDGQAWSVTTLNETLGPLSGTSDTNIWVAGEKNVHRFDGQTWNALELPDLGYSGASDIAAISDQEAWISGWRAYHYTGAAWQAATPIDYDGYSIFALSGNDVWLAGSKVYHYAGSSQLTSVDGVVYGFASLWGDAGELWGLSKSGTLYRRDGATWRAGESLNATATWLHGTSGSNLWAVGMNGLMAHFDGTAWKLSGTPGASDESPYAIHGSAADDTWLVGSNVTAHFDGTTWSDVATPESFHSLWVDSSTEVYAGGYSGVWSWNGAGWDKLMQTDSDVLAVQGLGNRELWLATSDGTVHHYSPDKIDSYSIGSYSSEKVLWANGACDVWSTDVGLMHFDGVTWSDVTPSVLRDKYIRSLYGRGRNDMYAATGDELFHFDGVAWTRLSGAPPTYRLWGCGDELFTAGPSQVSHLKNSTWQSFPTDTELWGYNTPAWSAGAGSLLWAGNYGVMRKTP